MGGKFIHGVWINILFVLVALSLIVCLLFVTGVKPAKASDPEYNVCAEYPSNPVFDPLERAYYPSVIFDGTTYHLWYDDGTTTRYTTSTDGISWGAGTLTTGLLSSNAAPGTRRASRLWLSHLV